MIWIPNVNINDLLLGKDLLKFLSDGGNLFDTILMGGQITFEGLVFLLQSLQFRQTTRAEILQIHQRIFNFSIQIQVNSSKQDRLVIDG